MGIKERQKACLFSLRLSLLFTLQAISKTHFPLSVNGELLKRELLQKR